MIKDLCEKFIRQLIEKKQQLHDKMQSASKDELHEYIEADQLLTQLQKVLFAYKE